MIAIIFFGLLQIANAQFCCPSAGVWSDWKGDLSTCYDYCGGVGNMTMTRTCLSAAWQPSCPCVGETTQEVSCETYPCIYPRNFSCFTGKTLQVVNGLFQCWAGNGSAVTTPPPVPPTPCETCPPQGIWGEWRNSAVGNFAVCSDTCGSCGRINRTRSCLSTSYGCPCSGNNWELQTCNAIPCTNRTSECCLAFAKTTVNGTTACTPTFPSVVINTTTNCVSPDGLWNPWSSWATCSASCGLCGTRTRTRICGGDPYGCPCKGNTTEIQPCGGNACPGGTCCGSATKITSYDGMEICLAVKPVAVTTPGSWTPWTPNYGRVCNDTCGGFGSVLSFRFCLPPGSNCLGSFGSVQPCNFSVCLAPRSSCAPGFVKAISGGTFLCAPA